MCLIKVEVTCFTNDLYIRSLNQTVEYFKDRQVDLIEDYQITHNIENKKYVININKANRLPMFMFIKQNNVKNTELFNKKNNFEIRIITSDDDREKHYRILEYIHNQLAGIQDYIDNGILLCEESENSIILAIGAETEYFPLLLLI